jgi:uncharacterized DUF497 family protein
VTPYDAENIEWDEGNEREYADHGLTLWQAEDVLRDMNFTLGTRAITLASG